VLAVFSAIAPIFALIVLGHVLRRIGFPSVAFWDINDRLVYWILFPALLFYKTSTLTLNGDLLGPYAVVVLGAFAVATLYALGVGRLLGLGGPVTSSVLQGAARHNTFIALAAAESLFGGDGLALAALATSMLIPVTNVVVVSRMVVLAHPADDTPIRPPIGREMLRNPLIVAVVLGVAVNLAGVGKIPVLHDTTRILGQAALPIMLLCVGANVRIRGLHAALSPLLLASAGKLVVFPAAMAGLILAAGLHGTAAVVAMIYGVVPTASSGYTLARALGGDAPLMAGIITFQTLIAFATMPLSIYLVRSAFG
jgi:malonate transporter